MRERTLTATDRRGFTLLELLVVLAIVALAAALASPALLSRGDPASRGLGALIPGAREAAAMRGETIHLRIAASGDWQMEGAGSSESSAIESGRVGPFPGLPLTLLVSPIGTCGFDARSTAAADAIRLDPMSCEIIAR